MVLKGKEDITKYWIIGDVHGCIFTLEKLLAKLPKDANPIFIGDLVDRGNFSKEVMELIQREGYIAIFGNHEYLMFNYARDAILRKKHSMWSLDKAYGGAQTVQSYKDDEETLLKHINYILNMPKYLEIDNYFLTHGFGLPYYQRKEHKSIKTKLFTTRLEEPTEDWEEGWERYETINIFGHTPYERPFFGKNYIGIDTGCVFGNRLSAVNLKTHKIISQTTIKKDIL